MSCLLAEGLGFAGFRVQGSKVRLSRVYGSTIRRLER